jgi:hypothetical protein
MQKVHYKGKAITMKDRETYPYLVYYLWHHTECGYLFYEGEDDRLTLDKDMVTCKRCLKILNKEENSEERAE